MKTQAKTGMALLASVITAAAIGCVPMQGPQGPYGEPVAEAARPEGHPEASEAPGAPAAAPQAVSAAPAAKAAAPTTAAECVALAAKPAGEMSSSSDPQKQLDQVFQDNRENFRCCVDALFARAQGAGRADASVALVVTLDSAGKLTSSDVVQSETSVQAPDVHACINDIAKALPYPKPGNDMDVRYKRVFQFKARR